MNRPQQGELYFMRWGPGEGHEYMKTRPSLIVSSNKVLKYSNVLTCIPLTSNQEKMQRGDILVQKNAMNRLMFDSVLKVQHISSWDSRRIVSYIGKVDDVLLNMLKDYLKDHFDIQ